MTKLLFGCGYLGERIAQKWHDAGEKVSIITRRTTRVSEFTQRGYSAIVADITRHKTLGNLPAAETVLFSVGFDRSADQSIQAVYAGGMRNLLAALPVGTNRFIYISTTGVYGPGNGEWVDEQTPADPRREGARASLAAEQLLAAHPCGKNAVILRLAGLYGPGRIPFLDRLRAGEPIPAFTSGYLNLIQVDDAAAVAFAADRAPRFDDGPRVYCVSDGHPVRRNEYYREVAQQIGAPPPVFVEPQADSPRAVRAQSDRRVRNRKMLDELCVKLIYPDYRLGLAGTLETQNQ